MALLQHCFKYEAKTPIASAGTLAIGAGGSRMAVIVPFMRTVAPELASLLEAHHQLDFDCRNRNGRLFVGDWYTDHPFTNEVVGDACFAGARRRNQNDYYFQNDSTDVHEEIISFHLARDGVRYTTDQIFVGAGMTSLLTAQMFMLKQRRVRRLYYARPIYTTYYYLAQMLDIELYRSTRIR